METIIRHVRDIDTDKRRALEHVIGQELRENQKDIIKIVTLGSQPVEEQDVVQPGKLPVWCNVYEGLTGEQIAAVEEVILQRSDLTRPS